jgi:hypothetical protein
MNLGNGEILFTTLYDTRYVRTMKSITLQGLRIFGKSADDDARIMNDVTNAKAFSVLKREYYPRLVTFTNTAEPKSLVEVSPESLNTRFGPGNTLNKITFQVVDQSTPLTTAVTDQFPELARERGLLPLRRLSCVFYASSTNKQSITSNDMMSPFGPERTFG